MSSFQHLSWDNQTAETQALGGAVKCYSTALILPLWFPWAQLPPPEAPAPLPSAGPLRALWPPAQLWQCCETPREALPEKLGAKMEQEANVRNHTKTFKKWARVA